MITSCRFVLIICDAQHPSSPMVLKIGLLTANPTPLSERDSSLHTQTVTHVYKSGASRTSRPWTMQSEPLWVCDRFRFIPQVHVAQIPRSVWHHLLTFAQPMNQGRPTGGPKWGQSSRRTGYFSRQTSIERTNGPRLPCREHRPSRHMVAAMPRPGFFSDPTLPMGLRIAYDAALTSV